VFSGNFTPPPPPPTQALEPTILFAARFFFCVLAISFRSSGSGSQTLVCVVTNRCVVLVAPKAYLFLLRPRLSPLFG